MGLNGWGNFQAEDTAPPPMHACQGLAAGAHPPPLALPLTLQELRGSLASSLVPLFSLYRVD